MKQILSRSRPRSGGDYSAWQNAGCAGASGSEVRLAGGDPVTKRLRKQIGGVRPADGTCQGAQRVRKVASAFLSGKNRAHRRRDALRCLRSLIVAEEKQFVLLDRAAERAPELILPENAASRVEKVLGVEIGVAQEFKT